MTKLVMEADQPEHTQMLHICRLTNNEKPERRTRPVTQAAGVPTEANAGVESRGAISNDNCGRSGSMRE